MITFQPGINKTYLEMSVCRGDTAWQCTATDIQVRPLNYSSPGEYRSSHASQWRRRGWVCSRLVSHQSGHSWLFTEHSGYDEWTRLS